ncbi:MAG: response regulator transcription factor [Bacteriovoracaceae bacterium]|nr:response regulator transcription factor [Bacteriovoracaceae bacterium]
MVSSLRSILIAEDDQDIAQLIKIKLVSENLNPIVCTTGEMALNKITSEEPIDLFLLDWLLPSITGIQLCHEIRTRAHYKKTPIIMVTALTRPENIIEGLEAGADDYITKPFDLDVLLAKVKVQLRRSENEKNVSQILRFRTLEIHLERVEASINQEKLALTATEFSILSLLASEPGNVFTREKLIRNIQGEQIFVTSRTVDTHIAGLRKKLGEESSLIETIRGVGYRFVPPEIKDK